MISAKGDDVLGVGVDDGCSLFRPSGKGDVDSNGHDTDGKS